MFKLATSVQTVSIKIVESFLRKKIFVIEKTIFFSKKKIS